MRPSPSSSLPLHTSGPGSAAQPCSHPSICKPLASVKPGLRSNHTGAGHTISRAPARSHRLLQAPRLRVSVWSSIPSSACPSQSLSGPITHFDEIRRAVRALCAHPIGRTRNHATGAHIGIIAITGCSQISKVLADLTITVIIEAVTRLFCILRIDGGDTRRQNLKPPNKAEQLRHTHLDSYSSNPAERLSSHRFDHHNRYRRHHMHLCPPRSLRTGIHTPWPNRRLNRRSHRHNSSTRHSPPSQTTASVFRVLHCVPQRPQFKVSVARSKPSSICPSQSLSMPSQRSRPPGTSRQVVIVPSTLQTVIPFMH